jgi:hypothetical protein
VITSAIVLSLGGAAAGAPPAPPDEPSVRTLQAAAARRAEAQPEQVRSWLARVRKAALLPALHVRVGRGLGAVVVSRDSDGIDRYTSTANDAWRFEVELGWSLDRLLFDGNELRLSREAQRVAARREEIEGRVARIYFARRRLQLAAATDGRADPERALEIDELGAELDALTGGLISDGAPP